MAGQRVKQDAYKIEAYGKITVGTTATKFDPIGLPTEIINAEASALIYIGHDSSVKTTTGFALFPGDSIYITESVCLIAAAEADARYIRKV